MKKRTLISSLIIGAALVFSACGKDGVDTPSVNVEAIPESSSESSSDEVVVNTVDEDTPPEDGMVRSRITNEWIDEDINNTRPVAVMIPNSSTASHSGLSKASVLYECNVEGSMTRLMGIFEDWEDIPKLGNVRSARDYFICWSFEWDAILVHYGGPFYIDEMIARDDTQNINLLNDTKSDYFTRDSAKNSTDNVFTSADQIERAIDKFGYPKEYRKNYADPQHYLFAPVKEPNTLEQYDKSISAQKIDMSKAYPVTNCYFLYNEETGLYDRYQSLSGSSDGPHIDIENNEQLSFKNIIVQNTYHEIRDQKGYLAFQVHDTTKDGYFFTNGKGIHITWEKVSDYSATRYYDDNGEEIKLNTGKTMVLILEDGDSFTVDGTSLVAK